MNKNAIQRYAVWARNELIEQVTQRAYQYGISEKGYGDENADVIFGRVLITEEKRQRYEFVMQIKEHGFQQVVEEVAYTWFNRFVALRFMEVNDYLPTHVRVLSDATGDFYPEILKDVLHLDLPGLNMAKVSELLNANSTEDLYRYILLTQCNALNDALPEMFEKLGSYTEMLLPNNILKPEGVIGRLVVDIPEEDFRDAVQIIGWLYQYYNTEPKQAVFDGLKKNVKITKEKIPAATQLFTPDWIVRYMVENSLGRVWLEHCRAESGLSAEYMNASYFGWKYYIEEAEQEPQVKAQLENIRIESKKLKPQDIKIIDPCMGSGHILVYAFDVLMQIYESQGYNPRDAAKLILEKNLYGLDIDRRAYQLAYFSLMMKARQYNRRIFTEDVKPQVYYPGGFPDGEEFGSLVKVNTLPSKPEEPKEITLLTENLETALNAWNFKRLLAQKYDVVVTNPPYMGSKGMSGKLAEFVKNDYPDSKGDLSTAFMEQTLHLCNKNGMMSMINIPVWMFLSSYEKLRENVLLNNTVINMLHLGRGVFGSDFGTTSFVIGKAHFKGYFGSYRRLYSKQGAVESIEQKEKWFCDGFGAFVASSDNYSLIPGSPVAYWVSKKFINCFQNQAVSDVAQARLGMATANNDKFLRNWHEINICKIGFCLNSRETAASSGKKWFPYNKGGEFRKWYGNLGYVVNWENEGLAIRSFKDEVTGRIRSHNYNLDYIFREGITWTFLSSSKFSARYFETGSLCDAVGCGLYSDKSLLPYIEGLLCSCVTEYILNVLNPSISFQPGNIGSIPFCITEQSKHLVTAIANNNVSLSRADWDAFETSWDFKRHPLV